MSTYNDPRLDDEATEVDLADYAYRRARARLTVARAMLGNVAKAQRPIDAALVARRYAEVDAAMRKAQDAARRLDAAQAEEAGQ